MGCRSRPCAVRCRGAVDLVLRAMKIRLSGASLGIPVSFGVAMRTGLAGDFAAAITPARTGAEPARYLVLAKARISPAATFLLLFAELFLEMLALVVVAMGIALFFTDEPDSSLAWIVGLVGGYATFVIGIGLAAVLLAWRRSSGPPPRWARRIGFNALRWRRIQRSLRRLRSSATLVRDARLDYFMLGLLVSVLHVLARLAVLPVIVYSLGARRRSRSSSSGRWRSSTGPWSRRCRAGAASWRWASRRR